MRLVKGFVVVGGDGDVVVVVVVVVFYLVFNINSIGATYRYRLSV